MNLWEVLLSILILSAGVPVMAISETNVLSAVSEVQEMTNLHLVESSALDDWEANSALPAQMVEGGEVYAVSETAVSLGECSAEEVEISNSHIDTQLFIPECNNGLFTD